MPTALIIEDDPDASLLLASLIEERGYRTVQTPSGEEGLKLARESEPDLLFLDIMLPDLDGYKICETLKLDRETNPIPIVMVTALSTPDNRLKGFRVGADAYVSKPYTPEDIDQAMKEALESRARVRNEHLDLFVHFDLASEAENLQAVNDLFGTFLHHSNFSEKEIHQLRTALLEMGQNAIEWGNRHDRDKLVRISTRVTPGTVEIRIVDEGPGFDPANIPHAAASGAEDPTQHFTVRQMLGLRDGGFGILITKGLVDEVHYNETGNAVTLVKRMRS